MPGGRTGGWGSHGVWDEHVYIAIFKIDNQQGLTVFIAHGILLNVTWQSGWEGNLGENGYTCMYMAKSLYCPPKTITTLLIGYTQYKIKGYVLVFLMEELCVPY